VSIQEPELSLSALHMSVKNDHVTEENVWSSKYIANFVKKCSVFIPWYCTFLVYGNYIL
jgi:hypothetical protein